MPELEHRIAVVSRRKYQNAWVRVAAAVSLGGSIFCGTLCAGMGPGFVMVVIVVGIIRVDMVSILADRRLPGRREGFSVRHVTGSVALGGKEAWIFLLGVFLLAARLLLSRRSAAMRSRTGEGPRW
ncbi:hypothetical protein KM043_006532 [Ampulex compressa]|nr:hypothetical protein KM043_006532 [Ampulex compressa]